MIQFSIILPTYNRIKNLKRMLESLQASLDGYKNWELIIIDNNSGDGTYEFCKSRFQSAANVKVLSNKNSSAYISRNIGIKNSVGKYLVFFEDDLIIPKNWYQQINDLIRESPNEAIFSFAIKSKEKYSHVLTVIQEYEKKKVIQKRSKSGCVSTPSMLVKRTIFDEYGLFNENNRGGDIEYTFRLLNNNEEITPVLDIFVYHEFVFSLINFIKRSFAYGFSFSVNTNLWMGQKKQFNESFLEKLNKNLKMPLIWAKHTSCSFLFALSMGYVHEISFIFGSVTQKFLLKENPVR